MFIYFFVFFYPLFFIFFEEYLPTSIKKTHYIFFSFFLIIIIGLRNKIGGDWWTYNALYETIREKHFIQLFSIKYEFGYLLLNWIVGIFDLKIYFVNFIVAIIFTSGLFYFCYQQPYKWIGILISIPYLVNVVAMGATKQSAALGFVFIAYVFWQKNKPYHYIFFIFLGFLFHKSAFLLTLLVIPILTTSNIILIIIIGSLVSMYQLQSMLHEYSSYFFNHIRQVVAGGAYIKIFMNFCAGIIYFLFISKNIKYESDRWLYIQITILTILLLVVTPIGSAAAERFSLYFIPLQIVALTRLISIINSQAIRLTIIMLVSTFYFFVLIVWFYFSNHIYMHVPYNFIDFNF